MKRVSGFRFQVLGFRFQVLRLSSFVLTLALLMTAEAKPPAFDLSAYKETLANYAKTEADAKASPMAKAKAKMARLVLELQTCEDKDFDAKVKEARTFIEQAGGLAVADEKVEFLLSAAETGGTFESPDVEKLAEAAAKGDAKARMRYVQMMLKRCRPGRDDFAYARSHDRRLDIVEAALKDPVLEKSRNDLELLRFEVLNDLGRREEAEKFARAKAEAAENAGLKRRWYGALASAYKAQARRYAEKPSPTILKKAEEMHLKMAALAKDGKSPDDFLAIAQIRLDSEDYAGAKEYVLKSRESKLNGKLQRQGELILGDAAFAAESWSEAADRFLPLFNEKGGNDHNQTVRTVQALFAADRRKEAIPLVKWLSEEKGGRYKQSRAQFAKLLKELAVEK